MTNYTDVKIIADTYYNRKDSRITTFQLYIPRFLLAEINTHGILAKSAASSRAIPVSKCIQQVIDEPFIPEHFGQNKPGMQAGEDLDAEKNLYAKAIWRRAKDDAVHQAKQLADAGVHKQHANRLLEPFRYVYQVVTATEWDNFYQLRTHPDAQPEFRDLAEKMLKVHLESAAVHCQYHMPYVNDDDCLEIKDIDQLFKISAARCARVSYKTHDGKKPLLEEDLKLCQQLIDSGHMSPFDHPAEADDITSYPTAVKHHSAPETKMWSNPDMHGRYWGWNSMRKIYERDNGIYPVRDSYELLL